MNIDNLKVLCDTNGTSGDESKVREAIISMLPDFCTYTVDNMGNLIVRNNKPCKEDKLALFAHMDEVGFIVTYITDDGYLYLSPVGGINNSALFGKKVSVKGHIGLAGGKAIHQCSKEESEKIPDISDIKVDFGYKNKEQAMKDVNLGDYGYFLPDFVEFGDKMIKSKAIDDRFGCLVLIDILKKADFALTAVFTVQEEIGIRGATVAASCLNPDFAIVVESTTASDLPDTADHKKVCKLKEGAVISFMDKGTIYDHKLYTEAMALAKEKNIKAQTKTLIAGGNDAAAVHKAADGVKVITASLPCRYIHSASSVASCYDMDSVEKIVFELAERYANG